VTVLILARHGETDWNRDGRYQGHATTPLNARGREQALELAERLRGVELAAVYSSDLPRALETAEVVARARGLRVIADPALREIDLGSWSGLTRSEIAERFPGADHHDGETREEFDERVLGAVTRIAAAHDGRRVLIVAHGGCIRALQRRVLGEAQPVLENCGVYELHAEGGVLRGID
jgi:2,3-bisphosphoglycerate-dependent phosphoglycerate mutase